jgi:uncharacterized Zn finger protein
MQCPYCLNGVELDGECLKVAWEPYYECGECGRIFDEDGNLIANELKVEE